MFKRNHEAVLGQASPLSAARSRQLATVLVAIALLLVGLALWSWQSQSHNQGPHALTSDGETVWLGVNQDLWVLDRQGRLQTRWQLPEQGLPRGVAQMRWLSAAQAATLGLAEQGLLVSSRFSGQLDVLSAQGKRVHRITLQWPADLARAGQDATYFALSDTGKLAVATGGDHTVALFDAQGRYLARSPKDTFFFTNGLFWTADGFWTTDTNHSELVLLDSNSLAVKQRLKLSEGGFLGDLVASPLALATVTPLKNGMRLGRISDVQPDGRSVDWRMPEGVHILEPRSLLWLGQTLLVADGETWSVLASSSPQQVPQAWGDAAMRAELAQLQAAKAQANLHHKGGLASGVLLLLGALLLLRRSQQRSGHAFLQAEQAHIAPALLARVQRYPDPDAPKALVRALAPSIALGVALLLLVSLVTVVLVMGLRMLGWRELSTFLAVPLLLIFSYFWSSHIIRKRAQLATSPDLQPFFNQHADRNLCEPSLFWPLRQPGEVVQASVAGFAQPSLWKARRSQWWVLSNQRLLIWQGSAFADARSFKLLAQWPLTGIAQVASRPGPQTTWLNWLASAHQIGVQLGVKPKRGAAIKCWMPAALVAQDLVQQAQRALAQPQPASVAAPAEGQPAPESVSASTAFAHQRAPISPALASALVPGWGQSLQGRKAVAMRLFVAAGLLWVGVLLPLIWVWWHQSAAIPALTVPPAAAMLLTLHGLAAYDARQSASA